MTFLQKNLIPCDIKSLSCITFQESTKYWIPEIENTVIKKYYKELSIILDNGCWKWFNKIFKKNCWFKLHTMHKICHQALKLAALPRGFSPIRNLRFTMGQEILLLIRLLQTTWKLQQNIDFDIIINPVLKDSRF